MATVKIYRDGALVDVPEESVDFSPETDAQRRVRVSVSRSQFAVASAAAGYITGADAENWAGGSALPTSVTDALDAIQDAGTRMAARIQARGADTIYRTSPLIALVQANLLLTDAQVDNLFDVAAGI